MIVYFLEALLATSIVVALFAAWFGGKRLGRRIQSELASHPQMGVVQGAILMLLSLLLGFCFAGAMTRFVERQDIIVREAKAIGTLYQRADLLDAEHRARVRSVLREYGRERFILFDQGGRSNEAPINARLASLLAHLWRAVVEGVESRPQFSTVLIPACNDVGDSLMIRNSAEARHIPMLVLVVLVACALASIVSIGLGVEMADKRLRGPAAILVFLIAATLWTTIDLDFPRIGFAKVSAEPLADVMRMMESEAADRNPTTGSTSR
jgi:hypothetical protein